MSSESSLKLQHHLIQLLAMNKFGICFQWHNEHFKPKMLLFSVGNGALNAPRYWQWSNELLRDIVNGAMNYSAILATDNELLHDGDFTMRMGNLSSAFEKADTSNCLSLWCDKLIPGLGGIRFRIANSCTRWRGILKDSYRMGDGRIFLRISASLSLKMNLISGGSISLDGTFKVGLALHFYWELGYKPMQTSQ